MGYYDDHTETRGRGRSSLLFTSLISAVIGGLIVLLLSPVLSRAGFPPASPGGEAPDNSFTEKKSISVDVTTDITKAVERVQPAVVGVVNLQRDNPFQPEALQRGTGSGIIFDKGNGKARIVTNHHVIAGADHVQVVISGGDDAKQVTAKVLGSDDISDLAVLEIPDKHVKTVANFGNSDAIKAGEPAIAIGNPLGLEFSQSVTVGVISSPKRSIDVAESMSMDVIQTDAAINPGNSGGALVNAAGQVIGINSLKIAEQGVEGLGFAIPVNDAQPIINDLIRHGRVLRPYLGITLMDLQAIPQEYWSTELNLPSSVTAGVVVRDVMSGTSAAKAGLRSRDVIVALDDQPIRSGSELRKYLYKEKKIGDEIRITFYRNGSKETATTTLTQQPVEIFR
ncbi:serine protease Do [Planifilum fimeticola]|uniref:Serine protease Do n=1 Tax=Planifilum fimeticola TaxID=201975 RepID=A0A2T0LI75_9BACL|nr:S1C family serine protease [Planifilum fimeticola]PRX42110.1 serine protease Do [Planifilum fimeticola]